MAKVRHFRGIEVRLECGCTAVITTSFYRISSLIRAGIVGSYNRSGKWCHKHPGMCQVVEYGKTVRFE